MKSSTSLASRQAMRICAISWSFFSVIDMTWTNKCGSRAVGTKPALSHLKRHPAPAEAHGGGAGGQFRDEWAKIPAKNRRARPPPAARHPPLATRRSPPASCAAEERRSSSRILTLERPDNPVLYSLAKSATTLRQSSQPDKSQR